MKKILTLAACCVAMSFGAGAQAADSIPADTLAAMGLGGATVVSDAEAMEVRGMGYFGGTGSFALAGGGSIAYVGANNAGAGSINGYLAGGSFTASGENFSEAGRTVTKSKTVKIGRRVTRVTTTKSLRVYAGGFSSSSAF